MNASSASGVVKQPVADTSMRELSPAAGTVTVALPLSPAKLVVDTVTMNADVGNVLPVACCEKAMPVWLSVVAPLSHDHVNVASRLPMLPAVADKNRMEHSVGRFKLPTMVTAGEATVVAVKFVVKSNAAGVHPAPTNNGPLPAACVKRRVEAGTSVAPGANKTTI